MGFEPNPFPFLGDGSRKQPEEEGAGEEEKDKDAGFFQSLKNRLLPGNEDGEESDPSETEQ